MTKDLESLTVANLRAIAKKYNISGRWDMTKEQLVEAILKAEKNESVSENKSAKEEEKVDNQKDVEAEDKIEKKSADINPEKEYYLMNAQVGTLVAFKLSNGKVKSAKITKRSTSKRRFMLETNYGAEYIVPFEDVIWVRTSKKWPRGVYQLLKGIVQNEQ